MSVLRSAPRLHDIARSLQIARRDLETAIVPELGSATAQSTAAMMGKLLGMLAQELASIEAQDSAAAVAATESVQSALAGSADPLDRSLSRNLGEQVLRDAADSGGDAALLRLLETAASRDAVSGDAAVWRQYDALAAQRALRDAGAAEMAWDASYQESGAGSRSTRSGPQTAREFTAAELGTYLHDTGRVPRDAQILRLERLPGGFSKGTYLVELQLAPERPESWVLRRDLSFTPLQTCVVDEFPLLSALYSRGLPVPQPLWCEADPTRLGAPLIAVRRIAGSGDMSQWAQDTTQAREIALSAARILAQIHALDLATLPPMQTAAPGSNGNTPLEVAAHVERFWQAYRIEPDPLVELVFDWLRRHAPAPGARTLVHGDYGLHNLLVGDGRVNAVLDWEFAHAGDPREDLAYARPFVEKVLPWQEFVREYQAAGGAASDDNALRFYAVLGTLRNALGCMKVQHALRHGDVGIDSKFAYVGRSYAQQMLRAAAQLTGVAATTTGG